ncbi:MAG: hypothetical protein FWD77_01675 [Betaproteobacteria bacterium]|nr:hypothetical protein [Betaproteobacteria bacterium]
MLDPAVVLARVGRLRAWLGGKIDTESAAQEAARALMQQEIEARIDARTERIQAGIVAQRRKDAPELEFEDVFGSGNFMIFRESCFIQAPASTMRAQVFGGGGSSNRYQSGSIYGGYDGGTSSFGSYVSARGGGGCEGSYGGSYQGTPGFGINGDFNASGSIAEGIKGGIRASFRGNAIGTSLPGVVLLPGDYGSPLKEIRNAEEFYGCGANCYSFEGVNAKGGAGGGYAWKIITGLTVGSLISVVIGAGGEVGSADKGMPGLVIVEW